MQKDYGRSNFVWQDYQLGLYCEMQTGNMQPFNSIVRAAVYYPFSHTFNGMNQISSQILLYGAGRILITSFQMNTITLNLVAVRFLEWNFLLQNTGLVLLTDLHPLITET